MCIYIYVYVYIWVCRYGGAYNWCTQLCAQLGVHIIDYYFYFSVPFSFFGDANFSLFDKNWGKLAIAELPKAKTKNKQKTGYCQTPSRKTTTTKLTVAKLP